MIARTVIVVVLLLGAAVFGARAVAKIHCYPCASLRSDL